MFLFRHFRESRPPLFLPYNQGITVYGRLDRAVQSQHRRKVKGGRHDRALDDRSFGVPRLSVRVARDRPFCIASAGQRETFQNALDSETDALGPLTQNPGEGLGGPT